MSTQGTPSSSDTTDAQIGFPPLGTAPIGVHDLYRDLGNVGAIQLGLCLDSALALCGCRGVVGSRDLTRYHLGPLFHDIDGGSGGLHCRR